MSLSVEDISPLDRLICVRRLRQIVSTLETVQEEAAVLSQGILEMAQGQENNEKRN